MSRVEENEKVREELDKQLNDEELCKAILLHPEKATPVVLSASLPLLFDISKSLAVIADKLTAPSPGSINAIRIKNGLDPIG